MPNLVQIRWTPNLFQVKQLLSTFGGKLLPRNFGPEVDIDPALTLFFCVSQQSMGSLRYGTLGVPGGATSSGLKKCDAHKI